MEVYFRVRVHGERTTVRGLADLADTERLSLETCRVSPVDGFLYDFYFPVEPGRVQDLATVSQRYDFVREADFVEKLPATATSNPFDPILSAFTSRG